MFAKGVELVVGKLAIWVYLYETTQGESVRIAYNRVKTEAEGDVMDFCEDIVARFPQLLSERQATELVVRLTEEGEPLPRKTPLNKVSFLTNEDGLVAFVEAPGELESFAGLRKRHKALRSVKGSSPSQNDIQDEGKIVTMTAVELAYVNVNVATVQPFSLYLREGAEAELNFLEQTPLDKSLLIYGPPGTGKSVVAWFFALRQAKRGKKVLWYHFSQEDEMFVSYLTADLVSPVRLVGKIQELQADILILDGITKTTESYMNSIGIRWRDATNGKLCVIASQELNIKDEDLALRHYATPHRVFSWTKQEYQAALAYDKIKQQVAKNIAENWQSLSAEEWAEQFEDKFFLAGGSCRFMFHHTPTEVVRKLSIAVDHQVSDVTSFSTLQTGSNTLLQLTPAGTFVVSEYAMRLLNDKVSVEFVALARNAAGGNSSFDGWVLEMDFLRQISQSGGIEVYRDDKDYVDKDLKPRFIWPHLMRTKFHDPPSSSLSSIEQDCWLVPDRWNRGGYDAVRVEFVDNKRRLVVSFVQVPRAAKHSFNSRFMNEMLRVIAGLHPQTPITKKFYFMVPTGSEFACPTVDTAWKTSVFLLKFDRT